jgi:adenylylsulfate kinase
VQARKLLGGRLSLVFIKASVDNVIKRDVKGLYKKALAGEIDNFIGISSNVPYQVPLDADLVIDTDHNDQARSVRTLLDFIRANEKAGGNA